MMHGQKENIKKLKLLISFWVRMSAQYYFFHCTF